MSSIVDRASIRSVHKAGTYGLHIYLHSFQLLQHVQIHKDLPIIPVDPACKLEFSRNDTQQYTAVLTTHMVWGLWI